MGFVVFVLGTDWSIPGVFECMFFVQSLRRSGLTLHFCVHKDGLNILFFPHVLLAYDCVHMYC